MHAIKKAISIIKKYLGELMLIIGTGLFTYNIFNFSYRGGKGGEWISGGIDLPPLPDLGRYEFEYVAYYYSDDNLLFIAIGAMLIVAGVLIIKNKR